jgi:hypothetical protein
MRNIHVLPTDKPSRLHLAYDKDYYLSVEHFIQSDTKNYKSFNIYITSEEDINERDGCLLDNNVGLSTGFQILKCLEADVENGEYLFQDKDGKFTTGRCKKIILTTDTDLIADGVQAIDDEFLQWFVKNPSCEEVEVESNYRVKSGTIQEHNEGKAGYEYYDYKIIIPKEKPKQETLEEAADRLFKTHSNNTSLAEGHYDYMMDKEDFKEASLEIAKWQQERMYSEEDMKNAFDSAREFNSLDGIVDVHIVLPMGGDMSDLQPLHFTFKEWFEQFKKKQQ